MIISFLALRVYPGNIHCAHLVLEEHAQVVFIICPDPRCRLNCSCVKSSFAGSLTGENAVRNPYVQQSWCAHVLGQISA